MRNFNQNFKKKLRKINKFPWWTLTSASPTHLHLIRPLVHHTCQCNKMSSSCFPSLCMAKMSPQIPFPLKYLMFSHDCVLCALWEGGHCPSTSPLPSTKCLLSTALPQKVLSSKQQQLLSSPAPVCTKKPAVTHLMKIDNNLFKDFIGPYFILNEGKLLYHMVFQWSKLKCEE